MHETIEFPKNKEALMDSTEIFTLIERIAATSAKSAKLALLGEHAGDEGLRRVLEAAYSPLNTYGIALRPAPPDLERDGARFDEPTWAMLWQLERRELTGNAARAALAAEMARLDGASAELLWRIVAKDLRAGFSASTVGKVFPGLLPEYPYMRCSLPKKSNLAQFDWAAGVFSQKKANGLFANVNLLDSGAVTLVSRSGSEFPAEAFTELAAFVAGRFERGFQHHGELLVVEEGRILPREVGNGILNGVLQGGGFGPGQAPLYEVWDRIPLSAVVRKGSYAVPYRERLEALDGLLREVGDNDPVRLIDTRIFNSLKDAYAHYAELVAAGEEGTILKSPGLIWRDGTSKDAVKLKVEASCDLKIVGIVPGRAGTRTEGRAGSLACESECGKLRVDVTVKNEAMRCALDADPQSWIGRIVPVLFNEVMRPGPHNSLHSLFLPRLEEAGWRPDKSVADDLDRVLEQFEGAKAMQAVA
jgi:DNA ligase-1